MAALQGMTGLAGPTVPQEPVGETGRPASNWGGSVDSRHKIPGDSSEQWGYEAASYGAVIDNSQESLKGQPLPGLVSQRTPQVHSAPYPRGVQQDPLVAQRQMMELHGRDLGGDDLTYRMPIPYEQHLSANGGLFTDSPNQDILNRSVPGQLRAGSNDVDQGYGSENGFGFQFGKLIKRWYADPVPLDRTGTIPGERPFLGHHPSAWQNRLDNDSTFGVSGDISVGMNLADTPTGSPTPWEQPPNPTYRPTTSYSDESGYEGGWVAG